MEQEDKIKIINKEFTKTLGEITASAISDELKKTQSIVTNFQKQIGKRLECCFKPLSLFSDGLKFNFSKLNIAFEKLNEKLKQLSEPQKKLAKRMIENGWYYSLELPIDAYKLLERNNYDFNKILIEFYEQYQEDMFNKIVSQYPHRKSILAKAYEAHKKGDFELSIPVMLTQADGISEELFSEKLFSKNNKRLATEKQKQIIFDENDFIDKCFCIQLATIGQLNENYNPAAYKECKKFNRHTVLHGKDINYAKKINSIKCLVMLNFLSEIKENYYEDKT